MAMNKENLYTYILCIADNTLILGQRMGELCGHGPTLETDIACTNISLDLLGQTRSFYQYASSLTACDKVNEDTIAFLRKEKEYYNVLLVELPNVDFAHVVAKLFFFSSFYEEFLHQLSLSKDFTLAAIAKKSVKEIAYHKIFSSDWVKRLGNGTPESRLKMQSAVDILWPYLEELFIKTQNDDIVISSGYGVKVNTFHKSYYDKIRSVILASNLSVPETKGSIKGGKIGTHTEYMGYILTEMQYMQLTYPNMEW